jgi:hypothetical protein
MANYKLILLVALTALLGLVSCEKSEVPASPEAEPDKSGWFDWLNKEEEPEVVESKGWFDWIQDEEVADTEEKGWFTKR